MRFKTARLSEAFTTDFTFVRFFPKMCANVFLQSTRLTKSFITSSTLEFLQFGMNELVLFQFCFQMEFLVTDGAFVLFFLMMHKHVMTELSRSLELFVNRTFRAFEGLLFQMNVLMTFSS